MASERSEAAAARVAAAALRAQQLGLRLARLRAGESSTKDDVVLARVSAANQQTEAARAQQSLLRAYARSAALRKGWNPPERPAEDTAPPHPPADPVGPAPSALVEENRILRHALVSIASSGEVKGGWSKDRRQQLWRTLAEQCAADSWQSWSRALCLTAVSLVPGLGGAAVTGYDDRGAPHLLAVTDEWSRQLEEIAQVVGEGPGLQAHRTQVPVLVRNLATEQGRWPGYAVTAADAGLRTVYALPVQLEGVGLASLILYPSDQRTDGWRGWTEGVYLAAVAAKALLADLDAVEDGWPLGSPDDNQFAMATGVLAVALGVSVDEASARLRAFAFSNARSLGEVAQAVIVGSLRLT